MSDLESGVRPTNGSRYSIKQLLDLSTTAYAPFDLSKFSFDAARAGVIPSLEDCVVTSRRSSVAHPRVASIETTNTEEPSQYKMHNTQEPERRPQNPPTSVLAQKHNGFARFLKKHSSPTHQRVTAGGRIVPMEQRNIGTQFESLVCRPPKQQGPYRKIQDGRSDAGKCSTNAEVVSQGYPNSQQHNPYSRDFPSFRMPNGVHPQRMLPPSNIRDRELFSCRTDLQPGLPQSNINNLPQTLPMANEVESYYLGLVPGHYGTLVSGQTINGLAGSTLCSPASPWPYFGESGVSLWPQSAPTVQDLIDQYIISAQNSLAYWTKCYDELDQQLKILDRQRALTTLNGDLVNQRRVIVQQRSDTRDIIDKLKGFLTMHEQVNIAAGYNSVTPAFNANAPVYVPIEQQLHLPTTGMPPIGGTQETSAGDIFQKPRASNVRRPIPIVPPPKLQTDIALAGPESHMSPESPDRSMVDEWGVKRGCAPPELRRQQSEIADSINEAFSRASLSSQSRESVRVALPVSFAQSTMVLAGHSRNVSRNSVEEGMHLEPERAPPEVEAFYERQLDALRQPEGIVTKVNMPDGSCIDVRGQGLKRPDPANMSEFERGYWLKDHKNSHTPSSHRSQATQRARQGTVTPIHQVIPLDVASTPSIRSIRSENFSDKENMTVMPPLHQKAATDAFLEKHNAVDRQEKLSLREYKSRSLKEFNEAYQFSQIVQSASRSARHRPSATTSVTMPREAPLRGSSVYDRGSMPPSSIGTQFPRAEQQFVSRVDECSADGLGNKGISSISLQNVHAVAQLPHNLDGPVDNSKSPRSILSRVGKAISPRLLRRNTANGGAWYGPHYREVIERALICDDAAPRQRSPLRTSK